MATAVLEVAKKFQVSSLKSLGEKLFPQKRPKFYFRPMKNEKWAIFKAPKQAQLIEWRAQNLSQFSSMLCEFMHKILPLYS